MRRFGFPRDEVPGRYQALIHPALRSGPIVAGRARSGRPSRLGRHMRPREVRVDYGATGGHQSAWCPAFQGRSRWRLAPSLPATAVGRTHYAARAGPRLDRREAREEHRLSPLLTRDPQGVSCPDGAASRDPDRLSLPRTTGPYNAAWEPSLQIADRNRVGTTMHERVTRHCVTQLRASFIMPIRM